jgi:hypothetical protein
MEKVRFLKNAKQYNMPIEFTTFFYGQGAMRCINKHIIQRKKRELAIVPGGHPTKNTRLLLN